MKFREQPGELLLFSRLSVILLIALQAGAMGEIASQNAEKIGRNQNFSHTDNELLGKNRVS